MLNTVEVPKPLFSKGDLVLAKLAGDEKYEIYQIVDHPTAQYRYNYGPSDLQQKFRTFTYPLCKGTPKNDGYYYSYPQIGEYTLFPYFTLS